MKKKLRLNKETLRTLTSSAAKNVAGGLDRYGVGRIALVSVPPGACKESEVKDFCPIGPPNSKVTECYRGVCF